MANYLSGGKEERGGSIVSRRYIGWKCMFNLQSKACQSLVVSKIEDSSASLSCILCSISTAVV